MEPNQRETGLWYRALRMSAGVSLRRAAELAGISPSFLSNLENGKRVWTEDVRSRCKKALNQ